MRNKILNCCIFSLPIYIFYLCITVWIEQSAGLYGMKFGVTLGEGGCGLVIT